MASHISWQRDTVKSPHIADPVAVIVARDVPTTSNANPRQNYTIYLPVTSDFENLINQPLSAFTFPETASGLPQIHVHIHGGAWRDPFLTSASIEADVAHAFSDKDLPIKAIASINYTLSPFPTHPEAPYNPIKDNHSDPSREAVHPAHVRDALSAFAELARLGLKDDSYVLSGHSCGACISFQSMLQPPKYHGLNLPIPPRPAALIGMNGLYDLQKLVYDLGESHANLSRVYEDLIGIAFGKDQEKWPAASPARFNPNELAKNIVDGSAPKVVLIDQSTADQLVPMNEADVMEENLKAVEGIRVVRGNRCTGVHAAPWEEGYMIWETVKDVLKLL